jgi:hypothetical protein
MARRGGVVRVRAKVCALANAMTWTTGTWHSSQMHAAVSRPVIDRDKPLPINMRSEPCNPHRGDGLCPGVGDMTTA